MTEKESAALKSYRAALAIPDQDDGAPMVFDGKTVRNAIRELVRLERLDACIEAENVHIALRGEGDRLSGFVRSNEFAGRVYEGLYARCSEVDFTERDVADSIKAAWSELAPTLTTEEIELLRGLHENWPQSVNEENIVIVGRLVGLGYVATEGDYEGVLIRLSESGKQKVIEKGRD